MRPVGVIVEGKQLNLNNQQQQLNNKQYLQRQNAKRDSTVAVGETPPPPLPNRATETTTAKSPSRKWTSAFRVVQSMTRFRNLPKVFLFKKNFGFWFIYFDFLCHHPFVIICC
uniref:Uncharacterized protein n=1 Tax=Meloidogyne enterolobii TaxID=390850 RepID=A0A6V7WHP6_MELEN|nr:unnamed protein product [Meloidogyne enterolobii]